MRPATAAGRFFRPRGGPDSRQSGSARWCAKVVPQPGDHVPTRGLARKQTQRRAEALKSWPPAQPAASADHVAPPTVRGGLSGHFGADGIEPPAEVFKPLGVVDHAARSWASSRSIAARTLSTLITPGSAMRPCMTLLSHWYSSPASAAITGQRPLAAETRRFMMVNRDSLFMANNLVLKYYERKPKILDGGGMFTAMGTQPIIDNISSNVYRLRKQRRWSQAQLGLAAGTSQKVISNLENASERGIYPTMDTVLAVADALGVSAFALMAPVSVSSIDKLSGRDVARLLDNYLELPPDKRKTVDSVLDLARKAG